jgi:hypothetical protein
MGFRTGTTDKTQGKYQGQQQENIPVFPFLTSNLHGFTSLLIRELGN